jgi:hypothetical protein
MNTPYVISSLHTARKFTLAALLAVSSIASAQTATQEPAPAMQEPQSAAPAVAVEDRKIDQFADAYIAVQQIQSQATQQMSAITDADKAQKVKQEAETQMIEAVQRNGLQIEEFNQIVQAMASDPSLRDKVSGRIDERKHTS